MSLWRTSLTFSAFKYLRWSAFDFVTSFVISQDIFLILFCKNGPTSSATCPAAGKFPTESFLPEWNILHRAKSSHMAAPICARVEAVGGQGRGWTGPGADGSGWLWVADLWDHIIGLPALQFLPHQPLHLLPVGVGVSSQTLILTDKNRLTCAVCLHAHKKHWISDKRHCGYSKST